MLAGHVVRTAFHMGWLGLVNVDLIARAVSLVGPGGFCKVTFRTPHGSRSSLLREGAAALLRRCEERATRDRVDSLVEVERSLRFVGFSPRRGAYPSTSGC